MREFFFPPPFSFFFVNFLLYVSFLLLLSFLSVFIIFSGTFCHQFFFVGDEENLRVSSGLMVTCQPHLVCDPPGCFICKLVRDALIATEASRRRLVFDRSTGTAKGFCA